MPPILTQRAFLKTTATSFFFFADQAHEARRGTVVGVFSAVFLIGNSGGAFVFGYVAHRFGYGVMWSTLTVLLLAGAVLRLGQRDELGGGLRPPPSDAPRA